MRLFIMGTVLGILGNFLAEYWFAWMYPKGIPQLVAQIGAIAMGIAIILYLISVRNILKKDY